MTDIEICQQATLYWRMTQSSRRQPGEPQLRRSGNCTRNFTMTIEILYLTAQIQRWLNMRVARHLAAQAEKLAAK
jgi:hypothetical protein